MSANPTFTDFMRAIAQAAGQSTTSQPTTGSTSSTTSQPTTSQSTTSSTTSQPTNQPRYSPFQYLGSFSTNTRDMNAFLDGLLGHRNESEDLKESEYSRKLAETTFNAMSTCVVTMLNNPCNSTEFGDAWQKLCIFYSIFNAMNSDGGQSVQHIPEWYFREAWNNNEDENEEDE